MASNSTNATTDNNVNGVEHGETSEKERPGVFSAAKAMPSVLEKNKSKSEKKVLFPGDITIKAQLDNDIRCISYNNQELTFVDLLKLLERMFKQAVKASDDGLVLKYKDSEGDFVTMEDTDDVGFAIRTCGGLNIKILRAKSDEDVKLKSSEIKEELSKIRGKLDWLLEQLEVRDVEFDKPSAPTLSSLNFKESPTETGAAVAVVSVPSTSEFDPLKGVGHPSSDDGLTTVAHGAQSQPQTAPANQVKQVTESFQPTSRDSPLGVSSSSSISNRGTGQHEQPCPQPSHQVHNSLFDGVRGATVKPEKNSNYPHMTNQNPAASSQYQSAGTSATTNQAPVQAYQQQQPPPPQQSAAASMYGQAPAPSYSNANQYQSPPTSYGGTASSYAPPPNNAPTTWGDSNANNSQARGYPQTGMTAGQQSYISSPLPTSSASAVYGAPVPQGSAYGLGNAPPQMGNPGSSAIGSSQATSQIGGYETLPYPSMVPIGRSPMPSPQIGAQTAPPQMGMGGVQAPQVGMGAVQAPPTQMGSVQAAPQMGMGGVQAPQVGMGGVQAPPGGAPPQMAGPPPMMSRPGPGVSNPYARTGANSY